MSDAAADHAYRRAGIGQGLEWGARPAVLVIDFSTGFTDGGCSFGADLDREVAATARLLSVAREKGLPVVFTTIGYGSSRAEAGLWGRKMPALAELALDGPWVEIDPRLGRTDEEPIVVKKGASGFFGTNLDAILVSQGVDTVVLCGATTSGCVRATAIDLMQHGWPAVVPRECVGDRAQAPHEANLFDIQAKYGDVVSLDEALAYLAGVSENSVAFQG